MASGAVKWFDGKKGYGFITPDLGPRDVFVHASAVMAAGLPRLVPGQRVDFELAQDGEGRLIALGLVARDNGPDDGESERRPNDGGSGRKEIAAGSA